jgi:hypothetical protein
VAQTAGRAGALTRREALTRLLVSSWGLIVACRQDVRPTQVRGVVTDVKISSFTQIQAFSLRSDEGEAFEFIVEGNVGITPGHLREHMLLGDPVIVSIRYDNDLVIATQVDDAIPATTTTAAP